VNKQIASRFRKRSTGCGDSRTFFQFL